MEPDCDVIIVGAGVAGLAALEELHAGGITVRCLEARDRIGGRILTAHDPQVSVPIELGAEFIHGKPPEIWDFVTQGGLTTQERDRTPVYLRAGEINGGEEISKQVEKAVSDVRAAARQHGDESLAQFLAHGSYPDEVKEWAALYVEGFNAARRERIGTAALSEAAEASARVDGDQLFSITAGYDRIPRCMVQPVANFERIVRLGAIVDRIQWQPGKVAVHVRCASGERRETLLCRQVIVTVPLGVLQAEPGALGAIRFDPEPGKVLKAARALESGAVYRITLQFETPFWEARPELCSARFFFSQQPVFPTWWKPASAGVPILVGWSAGPAADQLAGLPEAEIIARAVASLERMVGIPASPVKSAWFHDWQADPFSRGAYSYIPVGQLRARTTLVESVRATLYFAGEATDCSGQGGTVHGAIASGRRAARQALADYRKISRLTA